MWKKYHIAIVLKGCFTVAFLLKMLSLQNKTLLYMYLYLQKTTRQ